MKINHKILSVPPYISTSWHNIQSLSLKENLLQIELHNGNLISIPGLEKETISQIFKTHEEILEQNEQSANVSDATDGLFSNMEKLGVSFKVPFDLEKLGLSNINSLLQHNIEYASSPNLPQELLTRISSMMSMMGLDQQNMHLPEAEPHCNCPYCQIARAVNGEQPKSSLPETSSSEEEEVSDEELNFREWIIEEIGDKLYKVSNPDNSAENYQVFLGTPMGCTCGHKNCEHLRAVLNS